MRVVIALPLFIMTIQQLVLLVDGGCGSKVENEIPCDIREGGLLKCYMGPSQEGRRIFVSGYTPTKTRFNINLSSGYDRSLHLDFRTSYYDKYTVVATNYANYRWGTPEKLVYKAENWPISPNTPFCIEIAVKSDRYEIKLDNKHLLDFKFRKETADPANFPIVYTQDDIIVKEASFTP